MVGDDRRRRIRSLGVKELDHRWSAVRGGGEVRSTGASSSLRPYSSEGHQAKNPTSPPAGPEARYESSVLHNGLHNGLVKISEPISFSQIFFVSTPPAPPHAVFFRRRPRSLPSLGSSCYQGQDHAESSYMTELEPIVSLYFLQLPFLSLRQRLSENVHLT